MNFSDRVFMIRGNYETEMMTNSFDFKQECIAKYDQQIFELCVNSFRNMPISAIINNKFLCVHSGISPKLTTLHEMNQINRFCEPGLDDPILDLLWSDPSQDEEGVIQDGAEYCENSQRGCSVVFGAVLLNRFLKENQLRCIIRGNQFYENGFKYYQWPGNLKIPQIVSIFSAPNYCDIYNNKGAFLTLQNNQFDIYKLSQQDKPYVMPTFVNIFEWSLPFITHKISQMAYYFLNLKQEDQHDSEDEQLKEELKFLDKKMELMGIEDINALTKSTVSSDAKKNLTDKVLFAKKQRVEKALQRQAEKMQYFKKILKEDPTDVHMKVTTIPSKQKEH